MFRVVFTSIQGNNVLLWWRHCKLWLLLITYFYLSSQTLSPKSAQRTIFCIALISLIFHLFFKFVTYLFCMKVCGVPRCRKRYDEKDYNTTFHRFPKNEEVKKEWLKAIGRPNWSPGKFTTICSTHFESSCFMEGGTKRLLYRNAIPSKNLPSDQNQARTCKSPTEGGIQRCLQIKTNLSEEQHCTGRINVDSSSSNPQICNSYQFTYHPIQSNHKNKTEEELQNCLEIKTNLSEGQTCTGIINVDSSPSNFQICNYELTKRQIKVDHNYCKLNVTAQSQYELSQLRKQIKTQQQKIRRREKRINRLKEMKIKNPKTRRRQRRINCIKEVKSSECIKKVGSSECLKETESNLILPFLNDDALVENTFETHLMRSFCF